MHKLAVAFFYACAILSIFVTALVFIGKASAQQPSSTNYRVGNAIAASRPPMLSPSRSRGTVQAKARCTEPCAECSYARGNPGLTECQLHG